MSTPAEIKVIRKRSEVRAPATLDLGAERESCRELLQTMIRGIVDYPDSVKVAIQVGERTTIYRIDCDQKCLGQIIGAKGKNISGVRAVVAATMARKGIRAIVEIPYFAIAEA